MNTTKTPTRYPTIVNLKELKLEGESFYFSRQTGELNKILEDLIGQHDYNIEIHLLPMGNAYEIRGKIDTTMDLTCARCGREIQQKVNDNFNEIIVVMKERPRAGHSGHTKGGHHHEEGPYCNYSSHYQFDLGEFAHEHIAAAEPYTPHCNQPDCEAHFKSAQSGSQAPAEKPSNSTPFDVLKNLTLKSQRD